MSTIAGTSTDSIEQYGFGELHPDKKLTRDKAREKAHSHALHTLFGICFLLVPAAIGCGVGAGINVNSTVILALGTASGAAFGTLLITGGVMYMHLLRYQATRKDEVVVSADEPKVGQTKINKVYVTKHASETNDLRKDLIRNAQSLVQISGNFCGGKAFREYLAILRIEMTYKPELVVELLCSFDLLEEEDKRQIRKLKHDFEKQFFYLITHTKIDRRTGGSTENHVKLTVVDKQHMVIGGTGYETSFCSFAGEKAAEPIPRASWKVNLAGWAARDKDAIIEGPSAEVASIQFDRLWTRWQKNTRNWKFWQREVSRFPRPSRIDEDVAQRLKGIHPQIEVERKEAEEKYGSGVKRFNVPVKVLISDPDKPNAITAAHIAAIKNAQQGDTIRIAHCSFNPNRHLMNALYDAINRQVKISLVTTGPFEGCPRGNMIVGKAQYHHYLSLLVGRTVRRSERMEDLRKEIKPNVDLRIYNVAKSMFHRKVMTVEHGSGELGQERKPSILLIGSYNLTRKGDQGDYEMDVAVEHDEVVRDANKTINKDLTELSRPVTFEEAYEEFRSFQTFWQRKYAASYYV